MVGPLMLLKMLHCRRARQEEKKLGHSSQDNSQPPVGISVMVETLEDKKHKCRVCLKPGMIPIYSSNGETDLSEALRSFGGINIYADDEYPKHLCQSCHHLLQDALLFRKTARQSDYKLRYEYQLGSESNNDNDNQIMENDDHLEETEGKHEDKNKNVNILKQDVYECKQCNLDFESFEDLTNHRMSDEHENKKHTCTVCNKTYTTQYYKKHIAMHTHDNTFMCDVCGKGFVMQSNFTKHRLTHFYDLPFQCSLCPYRGRFTESLKMHMRTHTGEKPYQCTACPSKFVNKSNLNKHMLTRHKGNHNFKCEDCGRGFYTKRSLELHIKVDHFGIKEHVCNICGKAFGYRKKMTKHQLKVHKREKFRSGRFPLYLQVQTKAAEEQHEV